MLSAKIFKRLKKSHSFGWIPLRSYADHPVSVATPTHSALNIPKQPKRKPFMKSIFLGEFDVEMLVYPELSKEVLQELKIKVDPVKKYFEKNVNPKKLLNSKMIPQEIMDSIKSLRLFGQTIPSEYGGNEQTAVETALISELVAKDLDVALILYSHNFLAVQSLLLFGTSQQKEKYLPLLATGEWIAGLCMSEILSSSDLSSLETKLVPTDKPDFFVLNGIKQWVINGINCNLFIVLAKFDFTTHTGNIIPLVRIVLVEKDAPGVTVTEFNEHLGLQASNICQVSFKNVSVCSDCLVGEETHGFEMCSQILNSQRYNIGAMATSLLKNLLHDASDFINSRKQLTTSLNECEAIQNKCAEIAKCIYTLESMTYHTALLMDQYDNPDCALELAIIKVFSFTEGRRSLDLIMELMGGRAFLNSEIFQKYFKDFRTMEVFDGTTDIANLYITLIGLQHAGLSMNEEVRKHRYLYEYPAEVMKKILQFRRQSSDDPKLTLRLYEQLHPSLTPSANELEYCVLRFNYAIHVFFNRYGSDVINQQIELMRLADAAVKIYAMTAVLGRASRSYCIGLQSAEMEVKYARSICCEYKRLIQNELNDLIETELISGDFYSLKVGKNVLAHSGYYLQHPLERSY